MSHMAWLQHAFGGIRICVCVLILNAVVKLYQKSVVDKKTMAIFAAVAVLSFLTPLSPAVFVLVAGVLGLLLKKTGGEGK